ADGSFVAVFEVDAGTPGDRGNVFARRFDAGGAPLGPEFQVNTSTTDTQGNPSVARDAQGNFVVAWYDAQGDGDGSGVRARRFLAGGTARGGEFQVNTTTTGDQGPFAAGSAVAGDGFGNFVVTWQGPVGADIGDVFLQRYGVLSPTALQ